MRMVVLLCMVFSLLSCSTPQVTGNEAVSQMATESVTEADSSVFDYLPTYSGQLIRRDYYALSYREEYEQAEWVAYYLNTQK